MENSVKYQSFPCNNSTTTIKNANMLLKKKFTSKKCKINFAVLKDINFNFSSELVRKCATHFVASAIKTNCAAPFVDNVAIYYAVLIAERLPVKKENAQLVIK
jgi:hypothetical protein